MQIDLVVGSLFTIFHKQNLTSKCWYIYTSYRTPEEKIFVGGQQFIAHQCQDIVAVNVSLNSNAPARAILQ